ncbi:uncharacterized protein JCM6883_003959 [Sporobolomyces salmoneus]|uniref:uncharacterized protein n=1 Tax=Sporobolomyces salmoneus TaxID=183962 RepID=UPI0031773F9A
MTDRPVLLEDEPYLKKDGAYEDDNHEAMQKAMELKQASNRFDHLDSLKVADDTLVGKLTYDQLTLYEKKSVLINRELDSMNEHGFWKLGKYQWCIFFLCGFGYFLDLCWAQAFGLISGQIQQELGIADARIGDIFTAFSAGLTVGAFTWGLLVDIIGRKWCFNITCLLASVFGLIFAAPSNFGALCFICALIGLGVGGNIPIDATITLEFLPTNRRFLLCALSTFQPLGVVVSSLIAWGIVPKYACDTGLPSCSTGQTPCCTKSSNMGWRYFVLILGALTLAIFLLRFFAFSFHESPKFLLAKGKDEEAIRILYKIAKFNKAPTPNLTIEDFRLLEAHAMSETSMGSDEPLNGPQPTVLNTKQQAKTVLTRFVGQFKHLKGFFATKRMIWLSVTLWIAYMSLFWSFSIAGGFLPLILRQKGIDTSTSLDTTYRNYVIVYLPGVTATIFGSFLMEIPRLGRKWAMCFAAVLMGVSLFLYSVVDSFAGFTGMNLFEYWAQSLYAALLYAATPELFPAPVRGSGSGIASTLGRLSSTVAPIAAGTIFNPRTFSVCYLAGGAAFVSALAIACLPFDTKGRHTF